MTPQDPHGAKLGGEPRFLHGGTVWGAEAQSEDTVFSWLQRTLRQGCLMLPSPGVIFHAICVLTTPILSMEKLMLQLYVLSAGQSSLHVVLLIVACSACTLTPSM